MSDQAYINELIKRSRAAQESIAHYSQEQANALARAAGKAIYDNAEILSREAADETRMGIYEHKIVKHHAVAVGWKSMRDGKSVGVIEDDPVKKIVTLAKPMGVIGSITPSTNPTFTPGINAMMCLKGLNSLIVAPHPRAAACTAHAISLMADAIEKLGAPRDLLLSLEKPSIEMTNLLMSSVDVVIATGGAGMVKAAYSSGKPAYGVGQGNVQVVVAPDYKEFDVLAPTVIGDRIYDNGMPCSGEQMMFIPEANKKAILDAFAANGGFVADKGMAQQFRDLVFKDGILNRDVVGKTAVQVAEMLGLKVPATTQVLMIELDKFGEDEPLCREIMFPFVRFMTYANFRQAVSMAKTNLLMEGAGHTAIIYSHNEGDIRYFAQELPVGRILVCQAGATTGGNYTNGLTPTSSIGCGSWGGNSISENLSYRHLLNLTKISYAIPGATAPSYEDAWG
ncbi:aldehyde dehydrogenase family protein [Desulfovibrio sp. OttesenSCG-928-C14]|nr:aldehyde dehydrogenase family protein [Desulfovibrio sp. OttesenSCG-928-C14]